MTSLFQALIHIPGYGLIIDVISFFTPETSLSSGIKKESFNSICALTLLSVLELQVQVGNYSYTIK